MPAGIQTFDASGNLILDLTDRITRLIGSVVTGTVAGSIVVPEFSQGTPFFAVVDTGVLSGGWDYTGSGTAPMVPTISGTTLSWDRPRNAPGAAYHSNPRSVTIFYGVY